MNQTEQQKLMAEAFRQAFRDQFEPCPRLEPEDHPAADLEFLERLDSDALSEDERAEFLRHLEQCPFCKREIASFLKTGFLFEESEPDMVSPAAPVTAAVRRPNRFFTRTLPRILTTAAALLFVVGIGILQFDDAHRGMRARNALARVLTPNDSAFSGRLSDYGYNLNGTKPGLKDFDPIAFDADHADKVQKAYEKAIRRNPNDTKIPLDYARYTLYVLRQPERACALLEDCLKTAGGAENAEIQLALGVAALEQNDDAAAIAAFRRALELAPGSFDARLNLAVALAHSGATDEALTLLTELKDSAEAGPMERDIDWAVERLEEERRNLEIPESDGSAVEKTIQDGDRVQVSLGPGSAAGEERSFTVKGVQYTLRWCPPGEFTMGSPETEEGRGDDEQPHLVKLTRGFWILESEVTRQMWSSLMEKTLPEGSGVDSQCPVTCVSWDDCQKFCAKLSELTGELVLLPTEAQWEYACRAGTESPYAGTGNLDEMGWYEANSDGKSHEVKGKKPNAWGLYDMHGNVWEWCADWYGEDAYAESANAADPEGPQSGTLRAARGGSWSRAAGFCRSALRNADKPADRNNNGLGFRLILIPAAE